MLFKPPYFTPWTPPLGISILKSFLRPHGYSVRCFDFNTDPELWGMHHKYFAAIQSLEEVSINDGYSKLWWILNAHMLAYANGASPGECARVLETIIPLYGIPRDEEVIAALIPLVEKFYRQLAEAVDELDLSDYSVAGTSTYSTSLGSSLFLLRKIKEKYPHIKTVMGGGIFADDLALGSYNLETLLREYDYIDHVVLGEGEMLFLKLLEGELSHKRAISIADLKGGTLEMKDVPPPDFSDLRLDNYYHLSIEGARSCPFQCSFCSETIQWGDYRKKPIGLFAEQVIELAATNGNNSFFMGDSLMNPYVGQFARELIERKAGVLYDGYLRADKPVTHRDRTDLWAQSGLYRVRLGIESASARVLDSMDKMTTPAVIADALRSLATAGIRNTTYWIVGFPGETEEDFQDSLEFIRENHRNIYELEAHPYYYYPYGQIGSRLYDCRSLYPDDVTEIIRFKVWDILDVQPTRHERYERLRRISDLASTLGLPNIYTMPDRYQAEDRWLMLHPLTTLVYAGRHPHREEARGPEGEVVVYTDESALRGRGAVICHSLAVGKRLDEEKLAEAAALLARYNEMLRVSLRGGRYVPDDPDGRGDFLSVHEAGEDQTGVDERRVFELLLTEIEPEAGRSLRVALIRGEAASRVLLFAHRAVADTRGVVLLCEDLFRLYEQLAYGKEISLRPEGKLFSAFMGEMEAAGWGPTEDGGDGSADAGGAETEVVSLGPEAAKGLRSETLGQYGVTPRAVMLAALSKCLTVAGEDGARLYLKMDCREADGDLANTMANLTRTWPLPAQLLGSGDDPRGTQEAMRRLISGATMGEAVERSAEGESAESVLLNLEYFVEEPWVEADAWRSAGFMIESHAPASAYTLELAPVLGEEVRVIVRTRAGGGSRAIAERLSARLGAEMETILQRIKDYVGAREFWLREFGKHDGRPNLSTEGVGAEDGIATYDTVEIELAPELARSLQDGCASDLPDILLAAYGLLVSLLNGREEIAVAASLAEPGTSLRVAPVRLPLRGDLSFRRFVERAAHMTAQATQYAAQSFAILAGELPRVADGRGARPVFDVAFVFARAGDTREAAAALESSLARYQGAAAPVLSLAASGDDGGVVLRLRCLKNLFGEGSHVKLADYLRSVIEQAAADPNIPLERIQPARQAERVEVAEALAGDTFNFS